MRQLLSCRPCRGSGAHPPSPFANYEDVVVVFIDERARGLPGSLNRRFLFVSSCGGQQHSRQWLNYVAGWLL